MFDRNLSLDSSARLLEVHGPRLRELLGRTLDALWVAWDGSRDAWFSDEAVVLQVGETRVEVVCWRVGDIVLSWNAIDLARTPAWVTSWDRERKLCWRRDALGSVTAALGQSISAIHVLEHRSRRPGPRDGTWLLHGLEFTLASTTLLVFNALDENGLTLDPPNGADYRRLRV
jgi:hypothetical protein